jgi:hypothetical protein
VILPPIYGITDRRLSRAASAAENARRLIDAGIRAVQIREKDLADGVLLAEAESAALARFAGAALFIDDRTDITGSPGAASISAKTTLPAPGAPDPGRGFPIGADPRPRNRALAFADPSTTTWHWPRLRERREDGAGGLEALSRVVAERRPSWPSGDRSRASMQSGRRARTAAMITALNDLSAPCRAPGGRARAAAISPRKIWLIGFMGAGKTTIGKILARRFEAPFRPRRRVEATSGRTVRAIFESEGEAEFSPRTGLRRGEPRDRRGACDRRAERSSGGESAVDPPGRLRFPDGAFDALRRARVPAKADRPLRKRRAGAPFGSGFLSIEWPRFSLSPLETPEAAARRVVAQLEDERALSRSCPTFTATTRRWPRWLARAPKKFQKVVLLGDFRFPFGAIPTRSPRIGKIRGRRSQIQNARQVVIGADSGDLFNSIALHAARWTEEKLTPPNRRISSRCRWGLRRSSTATSRSATVLRRRGRLHLLRHRRLMNFRPATGRSALLRPQPHFLGLHGEERDSRRGDPRRAHLLC